MFKIADELKSKNGIENLKTDILRGHEKPIFPYSMQSQHKAKARLNAIAQAQAADRRFLNLFGDLCDLTLTEKVKNLPKFPLP